MAQRRPRAAGFPIRYCEGYKNVIASACQIIVLLLSSQHELLLRSSALALSLRLSSTRTITPPSSSRTLRGEIVETGGRVDLDQFPGGVSVPADREGQDAELSDSSSSSLGLFFRTTQNEKSASRQGASATTPTGKARKPEPDEPLECAICLEPLTQNGKVVPAKKGSSATKKSCSDSDIASVGRFLLQLCLSADRTGGRAAASSGGRNRERQEERGNARTALNSGTSQEGIVGTADENVPGAPSDSAVTVHRATESSFEQFLAEVVSIPDERETVRESDSRSPSADAGASGSTGRASPIDDDDHVAPPPACMWPRNGLWKRGKKMKSGKSKDHIEQKLPVRLLREPLPRGFPDSAFSQPLVFKYNGKNKDDVADCYETLPGCSSAVKRKLMSFGGATTPGSRSTTSSAALSAGTSFFSRSTSSSSSSTTAPSSPASSANSPASVRSFPFTQSSRPRTGSDTSVMENEEDDGYDCTSECLVLWKVDAENPDAIVLSHAVDSSSNMAEEEEGELEAQGINRENENYNRPRCLCDSRGSTERTKSNDILTLPHCQHSFHISCLEKDIRSRLRFFLGRENFSGVRALCNPYPCPLCRNEGLVAAIPMAQADLEWVYREEEHAVDESLRNGACKILTARGNRKSAGRDVSNNSGTGVCGGTRGGGARPINYAFNPHAHASELWSI
ncbi:unnamed protein product [Amoebophrya sp. A120]|nr:unnamed protein product [Amoebophrya sp. A120]|eukprot:GSA120T00021310001.1